MLGYEDEAIEGCTAERTVVLALLHGKRQKVGVVVSVSVGQQFGDIVAMLGFQVVLERELEQEAFGAVRAEQVSRVLHRTGHDQTGGRT